MNLRSLDEKSADSDLLSEMIGFSAGKLHHIGTVRHRRRDCRYRQNRSGPATHRISIDNRRHQGRNSGKLLGDSCSMVRCAQSSRCMWSHICCAPFCRLSASVLTS